MPMKKGKSRETISENIKEFHKGDRYKATKRKSGKKAADKQAVAAALNKARDSGAKIPKKKGSGKKTSKKSGR